MKVPKRIIFIFLFCSGICFANSPIFKLLKKGSTVEQYWENQRTEKEESSKFCPRDLEKGKTAFTMDREKAIRNLKIEKQFVGRKIVGVKNIGKTATWEAVSTFETAEKVSVKEANLAPIEIIGNVTINTNTVWDQDVHVDGRVTVEDAMLRILPGVTVSFASGTKWIKARNNGLIIAEGTPDDCVMFISDAQSSHQDYDFAIRIEASASPECRINYCYILFAEKGIWIEGIRLNHPLFGNKIEYCYDGIFQQGPFLTDVINNQIINCSSDGIEVYMESYDPYAPPTTETHITLEQNTIVGDFYYGWGQDCGIRIHGVQDYNDVGTVLMGNNLIAASYFYALNQVDGYMLEAYRYCHGYYGNYAIENPGNPFDDVYPQILAEDPFVNTYQHCPFHLLQDCNLIDTGYVNSSIPDDAPYLLGKTTSSDGAPDSNVADIGFHYNNWNYSNAGSTTLTADFNNDRTVDFSDLSLFIDFWLFDYLENYAIWHWDFNNDNIIDFGDLVFIADYWLGYFSFHSFASFAEQWKKQVDERFFNDKPDLNNDGLVNSADFALLANEWKQTGDADPNIEIHIYGNSDNGYIDVGISGSDYDTTQAFIFIDGGFIGEIEDFDEGGYLSIDSFSFRNGSHSLKAVVVDANDHITLSDNVMVDFNNTLNCMTVCGSFEPNEPFKISGIYLGTNELLIKLVDWNNSAVWSQQVSGSPNLIIPGTMFNGQIYDLVIEEHTGGIRAESWEEIWKKAISKKYEPSTSYKFAIFLPKTTFVGFHFNCRKRTVAEIIRVCESRGIAYVVLYKNQCNWENFASVLSSPNISYVYMVSHGGTNISEGGKTVQRTNFKLSGKYFFSSKHSVVSYKKSDYGDPNNVPSSYEELPGKWETSKRVHSMCSLGLGWTNQIRIAHLDICSQAKYTDMARYWINFDEVPILDQLFVSWNSVIGMLDDDWQKWSYDIWNQLGDGGTTYWHAQDYASKHNDKGSFILSKVRYYGYDQVTFTKQGN